MEEKINKKMKEVQDVKKTRGMRRSLEVPANWVVYVRGKTSDKMVETVARY